MKKEYGSIITSSTAFQRVLEMAQNVASSKATVLISGESGTGKELVAKLIHQKSSRSHRPLVAVNCAAVPDGLLESELFGHERGSFTGAISQRIGKFETSSNSTILLDEISELPLPLQAKLLRVLQEEEVDRVGGRQPIKVNLRVIATTNRDLRAMVAAGKFREDLYYRLNVIPLEILPLRQRPEDIVLLAEHFAQVTSILNSKPTSGFSAAAKRKLLAWSWPGNIRELENVTERAVLVSQRDEIQDFDIQTELHSHALSKTTEQYVLEAGLTVSEMEKRLIFKTLEKTNQNRTQAAKMLGISIRTLRNKLQEYKAVKGDQNESVIR